MTITLTVNPGFEVELPKPKAASAITKQPSSAKKDQVQVSEQRLVLIDDDNSGCGAWICICGTASVIACCFCAPGCACYAQNSLAASATAPFAKAVVPAVVEVFNGVAKAVVAVFA